jgi:hypothetical protein
MISDCRFDIDEFFKIFDRAVVNPQWVVNYLNLAVLLRIAQCGGKYDRIFHPIQHVALEVLVNCGNTSVLDRTQSGASGS